MAAVIDPADAERVFLAERLRELREALRTAPDSDAWREIERLMKEERAASRRRVARLRRLPVAW